MIRVMLGAVVGGAAALAAAGALAAQERVWVEAGPPAWLGVSYDVEWVATAGSCDARVVVQSVVQGAPADRAGIRPGDALVRVNGSPVAAGRLPALARRLSVGDSVRLAVVREGRTREVVAVADRRPARPTVVAPMRRHDGMAASDAPVIHVRADTVIARNLDRAGFRPGYGYWMARRDGGLDFRRVERFSGDAMDQRVMDLLVCAQRTQAAAPTPAPAPAAVQPVDLRALQQRADSLRTVILRRAMTRPGEAPPGVAEITEVRVAPPIPGRPGGEREIEVHTFRVADHLAAAARGVAGAEVTTLEPELAAYFRGVRDGLLVLRVAPGTPADRAGLEPGDVITRGNGRALETVGDLRQLLAAPHPERIELRVIRHGRARDLTIRRD